MTNKSTIILSFSSICAMEAVFSGGVLLYLNPYDSAGIEEIKKQYLPLARKSISIDRRQELQVEITWQRKDTSVGANVKAAHSEYCLVLRQQGKRLNKEELEGIRIWQIQKSSSIELIGFETVNFFGGGSRVHTAYTILAETPTIVMLNSERLAASDPSWNVELQIEKCQTLATKDVLVGLSLQPYLDTAKTAARSVLFVSSILAFVFFIYWYQLRRI